MFSCVSIHATDYEHFYCMATVLDRVSYSGGPWLDSCLDRLPNWSFYVVFSPVIEMLEYSHAPHNFVLVNDGPH